MTPSTKYWIFLIICAFGWMLVSLICPKLGLEEIGEDSKINF
jgi:hypothetical protein